MRLTFAVLLLTSTLYALKAASLTPEQKAKLEQYNKNCLSSSGAKPDQVSKARSGKFAGEPEVQKYFGCMMRSVGVINQAGQLQVDVLKTKVPKDMKRDEAMKVFFACKDKKGGNADETAYLLYKCFWEASPRHLGLDGQWAKRSKTKQRFLRYLYHPDGQPAVVKSTPPAPPALFTTHFTMGSDVPRPAFKTLSRSLNGHLSIPNFVPKHTCT
ncbi:uncharacterized protein LOC135124679 [Zophobas morio]|uniref:uncharacterized protein LOC135124679 n=1 Tax=Zophobas morio TaxID=2755281 RepID=UPI003083E91F